VSVLELNVTSLDGVVESGAVDGEGDECVAALVDDAVMSLCDDDASDVVKLLDGDEEPVATILDDVV